MITSFFKPKRSKRLSNNGTDANKNISKRPRIHDEITTNKSASRKDDDLSPLAKHANVTLGHSSIPSSKAGDDLLTNLTEESWRDALTSHVASSSFTKLAKFVASERSNKTVYPPQCDTFSALNFVPMQKVKVVIVGQDPYHQPNQGHGLAFSVRKGQTIPPSLRNIYKELMNDDQISNFQEKPTHGYLERWAQQGVLMLNAVLTVRRNEPNSHAKKGWESFTDEIIRILLSSHQKTDGGEEGGGKGGIVFLLWGKPAGKKAESIINQVIRPSFGQRGKVENPHVVICTSHPSPLGATKTDKPFTGSRCFSRANEALVQMGLDPIDWCVDDSAGKMVENVKPLSKFGRKGAVEISDV